MVCSSQEVRRGATESLRVFKSATRFNVLGALNCPLLSEEEALLRKRTTAAAASEGVPATAKLVMS
jgi:hypothetical protein